MTAQHPDTKRDRSVDEELNDPTRESMEQLGRADLDPELEPQEKEEVTGEKPAGQNSDWMPQ